MGVLWGYSWYDLCNLVDIGLPTYRWTLRAHNYDAAASALLTTAHLAATGFMFSLGSQHRQPVFRNWAFMVAFVLAIAWVFLMLWSNATAFSCIFAINCDNETMMTAAWPFFKQFSTGSIGGCFYGPQIVDDMNAIGKDNFVFPNNDPELKKNFLKKIFGYLARCEFWLKLGW